MMAIKRSRSLAAFVLYIMLSDMLAHKTPLVLSLKPYYFRYRLWMLILDLPTCAGDEHPARGL